MCELDSRGEHSFASICTSCGADTPVRFFDFVVSILMFQVHRLLTGNKPQGSGRVSAPHLQRLSKSTGSRTSCTRKYFAIAGYFAATASYMAYATLRYE